MFKSCVYATCCSMLLLQATSEDDMTIEESHARITQLFRKLADCDTFTDDELLTAALSNAVAILEDRENYCCAHCSTTSEGRA